MKIVIINKSDCIGGAAVVSNRLLCALRQRGVEATMLVMEASGEPDANIKEYGHSLRGKFYFLMERLNIFLHNHFSRANLFKVSTASHGFDLSNNTAVKDADAILLNWINQGALSLRSVEKICQLGKPVFWTMHDLWECTGICHLPNNCNKYTDKCGECKYLQSSNTTDLSLQVWKRKKALYAVHPNLRFVCVSQWVENRCKESSLLCDRSTTVISNAFPIEKFDYNRLPNFDGIAPDKIVMAIGAARLDDEVKGFPILIEAMNEIAEHRKELASKLHLLLYGNIRNASLIDQIRLPHTYVGTLKDTAEIANLFQRADIVLSTSLFETLGGTIVEGSAAGCIPVTFGCGGQVDIVDHKINGYIADYLSPISIADGIEWAASKPLSRQLVHDNIEKKFSSATIADKYISLINKYLK